MTKAMIRNGDLKKGDVVFIYATPPVDSVCGVVEYIDFPNVTIATIKMDGSKKKHPAKVTVDVSVSIPLSLLDEDKQKQVLSSKEQKRLKDLEPDPNLMDMFAGEY